MTADLSLHLVTDHRLPFARLRDLVEVLEGSVGEVEAARAAHGAREAGRIEA